MMLPILSDDAFISYGSRDYVKSVDQLKFALTSFILENNIQQPDNVIVKRYKQIKELKTTAWLRPMEYNAEAEKVCATMDFAYEGKIRKFQIVAGEGGVVNRPEEVYLLQDYESDREKLFASGTVKMKIDFWKVLAEAVQLTKMLHIDIYNNHDEKQQYRFVVGGFENLHYFDHVKGNDILINVLVKQSWEHGNHLYNNTLVQLVQQDLCNEFILPFIGKPIL